MGDIVRVKENSFFPADMIVLSSSEPEGMLYVETKNLDGETNLKLKSVAKDLVEPFSEDSTYANLAGTIISIEKPNNRIYKFDGNMSLAININRHEIPLSNENVVLRGMSLRNTEHVTGIVVYAGHDTKIQKNSTGAVYKTSDIMKITNKQILIVFLIQILCAAIGASIGSTWTV